MILALVASGLTLIFGIMDVVNFAHGELFMLGAYVGVHDHWRRPAISGSRWSRQPGHRAARRGDLSDDAAPAARPRSADHDPRHLRRLAGPAELRAVAVRPGGAQDPGAVHRPVHPVLPGIPVVPAGHRAAGGGDHRRALAVPQIRHLRHLDPRHDAGPGHGRGDGHPGAVGADRGVRDRLRHGGGQRRAVRPAGRRQPRDGASIGC